MGRSDWSSEQLAQELAQGFSLLARAERGGGLQGGEATALADGVLQCMNGALLKVSEALEAQSRMRREIAGLQHDLRVAEQARREAESGRDGRLVALEQELNALRDERRRLAEALEAMEQRRGVSSSCPADSYLTHPLVVRTAQDEFLGVSDLGGQRLCLREFLRVVERQAAQGVVVSSSWEQLRDGWLLSLGLTRGQGQSCSYALDTASVRTPSGNRVTVLRTICFNGEPVPDAYLLQMFRHLRDGVQE